MKKITSFFLALIMILSTVSFAAPSLVGTVGTAEEAESTNQASEEVSAEVLADDYSTLVLDLHFDNASESTTISKDFNSTLTVDNYGTVNFPSNFPANNKTRLTSSFTQSSFSNGALNVIENNAKDSWPRVIIQTNDTKPFPKGKYSIVVTVTNKNAQDRDINYSYGNTKLHGQTIKADTTGTFTFNSLFDGSKVYCPETFTAYNTTSPKQFDIYTTASKRYTEISFDRIQLYYTPMCTISFDANGVAGNSLDPVEIIAGSTIDLSQHTLSGDDNHNFIGWTDANGNDVSGVITISSDMVLKAKWQENFGTLVYNITFDNAEGETIPLEKDIAIDKYGTANIVEGFIDISKAKLYQSFVVSDKTVEYTPVVKNGKAEVKSDKGYPRFTIKSTGGSFPEGKYVLSVDFTNNNSTSKSLTFAHDNTGLGYKVDVPAGETRTCVVNLIYSDGILKCVESGTELSLSSVKYLVMYTHIGNTQVTPPYSYAYDNIKLYYKPLSKVNFVNDKTNETLDTLLLGSGTSINLDSYSFTNTDAAYFIGWADEEGNPVKGNVTIDGNRTFTAVWQDLQHEEYGRLLYALHFNTDQTDISMPVANYGIVNLPAGFPDASKTYLVSNFESTKIGNGKVTVTHSVNGGWPVVEMQFPANFPAGKYYLSYDATCVDTADGLYHSLKARANGTLQYGMLGAIGITKGQKDVPVSGYFTYINDTISYDVGTTHFETNFPRFTSLGIVANTKGKVTLEFDNLHVYYKAPITVSFADPANNAVSLPASATAFEGETYAGLNNLICVSKDGTKLFKGWATSENGEVIGNETAKLTSATTLYAVWEDRTDVTPNSYDLSSIRTDAYTGIRFKASVTTQQKAEVEEYGFIVTLKSLLGDKQLTHSDDITYVEGINYGVVNGESVDKIYEIKDDNVFFTAVVHGIPSTAEAYKAPFIVRPFTKRDGFYFYGDTVERSVYSVACAIREGNYQNLKDSEINTIKSILDICEK